MLVLKVLGVLIISTFTLSSSLTVMDFFGNGIKDNSKLRFAILENDIGDDFGPDITICSSIYMRSFIMEQSLFQVMNNVDHPWFSLYFLQLDETSMTFPLSLAVDGIYSHLTQVRANPLQWNHACIGIDTRTGFTTVSLNARIVFDEVLQYFVASESQLPLNISEKIILGKWYFQVGLSRLQSCSVVKALTSRTNGFRAWQLFPT